MHISRTGMHRSAQERTGAHGSAQERHIKSKKVHHERPINTQIITNLPSDAVVSDVIFFVVLMQQILFDFKKYVTLNF